MDAYIEGYVSGLSLPFLFVIIAITLYTLSKGADLLVDEAVVLSEEMGVSKMIIGATIVSLGTTLPEATVSVMAALSGNPDLSLGNAVGSIICDTGLILGIASIIRPLPLPKNIINRHGWIQLGSGVLLVLVSIPYMSLNEMFRQGGYISQGIGFVFVALLIIYIYLSIKWAKEDNGSSSIDREKIEASSKFSIFLKLFLGIFIVIVSSKILIPTVQETAIRMNVPNSVIAATLVAFGTSLPELVTAVTATLKGHGELAVGNIIGADILNVLFVVGSAAAFSKVGLNATPKFFTLYFPAMLFILVVFRIGTLLSKGNMKRFFGFILLGVYILVSIFSYIM